MKELLICFGYALALITGALAIYLLAFLIAYVCTITVGTGGLAIVAIVMLVLCGTLIIYVTRNY